MQNSQTKRSAEADRHENAFSFSFCDFYRSLGNPQGIQDYSCNNDLINSKNRYLSK